MDLGQNESGDKSPVKKGSGARSAAEWISVESEIIIEPGGKKETFFEISVPPNAEGSYFAYLVIQYVPARPEAKMATVVRPSATIEIAVYTRSSSPLHIEIKNLYLGPSKSGHPSELIFHAVNTGTWKCSIEGDILLYKDQKYYPIRIPIAYRADEKPVQIYPGSKVVFRCPLDEMPSAGDYNVTVRLLLNNKYKTVSQLKLKVPSSRTSKNIKGKMLSQAESDLDINIRPHLIEVTIVPGAIRTIPIVIQNRDKRPGHLVANISEVKMETNGQLTFPEKSENNFDWFRLDQDSFDILPHRTSVLKTIIEVPKDVQKIKSMTMAIRINISGPSLDNKWNSTSEFGVLLIANDPKATPAVLEISKFYLVRPSAKKNPSTALICLTNSGEKVTRFEGKIYLERANGQAIASMTIGLKREEVLLPGATREFRMVLPPIDEGEFSVRADFNTVGKKQQKVTKEERFISVAKFPKGLK